MTLWGMLDAKLKADRIYIVAVSSLSTGPRATNPGHSGLIRRITRSIRDQEPPE
ncbi:hypothetical protein PGT21_010381 [Puccinia graminis f. sp. tritici]|uniref:Uncharacterized protein n=1 Tax=Puccinia graminis f. sp. tritici TaxID=56615 RepID=A0A5B0PQS7_PUCGR|nr:hypothetical protein PGT21_010381 [Puccinia graminis f. sp. tritici]